MSFLAIIILGIVEGITEFLPVSSTGHLILMARFLGLTQTEFLKSFEIAIQLGAILSVVVLYWRSLLTDKEILRRITVAFFPTAILGLIFYKVIKKFLLGNHFIVVWALLLGGVFLVVFELLYRERENAKDVITAITFKQSFLIGVFQSLAMIPGVSRAAVTIIGGLMLGVKRKTIIEFSFLLAVPTMISAVALDLAKTASSFTSGQLVYLVIGFIVSFATAILAIKFLLSFVKRNNFIPFGIYRIILALLFLISK